MNKYNKLINHKLVLPRFGDKGTSIQAQLLDFAAKNPTLYSYCLIDKGDEFWLSTHVSDNPSYNTIDTAYCIDKIYQAILDNRYKNRYSKIIAYAQPPLNILCDAMSPLVYSLANEQLHHWKHMELEDLVQRCYCTLCELYNKGYYIHKSLLRESYKNSIISYLRANPVTQDNTISFDDPICADEDSLSVLDTISDSFYDEISEYETDIAEKELYEHVREWIIDRIGKEAYDKLVYEYANKKVSSNTSHLKRKLINKLKANKNKFLKTFMGE